MIFCPQGPWKDTGLDFPNHPRKKQIPKQKMLVKGQGNIFQEYVGEILDRCFVWND